MTLLILGRLDEVEAGLAEAEGLLEIVSGAASGVSRVRWAVAELHLRRGEFNDLESLIETIGSELRRNNDQHELFAVLRTQLTYLLLMDSGQEAEEVSQEFIRIAQSVNFVPDAHCCASILASKKGDPAQGRWHLQEARNSIESGEPSFLQRHLYFARADAHLLAGKQKWEPAWAKFGQNREALTANELRWDVAVCSMEWAEAHLLRGKAVDVARAKELFAEARAEFEAMGAPGWVQLIDEKMSALP